MYVKVGELVNTHGIKGEVRIISDFKYKNDVFKTNNNLYIGKNKEKLQINSYRKHKIFDMVTFKGINNINDVLIYKGEFVYINKEEIKIDGYYDEDLIGLDVYSNDKYIGKVSNILKGIKNDNLVVENNNRSLIPNISEFIEKIDLENKKIYIKEIEGLINENWYFKSIS